MSSDHIKRFFIVFPEKKQETVSLSLSYQVLRSICYQDIVLIMNEYRAYRSSKRDRPRHKKHLLTLLPTGTFCFVLFLFNSVYF